MKILPKNDFVFVREVKEMVSPGGIALPDSVVNKTWSADNDGKKGVVVAVGPGKLNKKGWRESMWGLHPGQQIVFSPHGNMTQVVGGEELTVIRRDSIFGEVTNAA